MTNSANPQVSILVPVYGVEPYIERCAESLFAQDYDNIQYVFVDDCSPDRSIEILRETMYRHQQREAQTLIVNHEHNRGLSAARNTALDHSTGEYIMVVDSDDWLADNTVVSTLVASMQETEADIVVFDHVDVYPHRSTASHKDIPTEKEAYLRYLIECRCTPSLATSFYRASLFRDHGVRNIEGLDMSEDYTVQPRLVYYADKIIYLRQALYCYRRVSGNSYLNNYRPPTSDAIPEVEVIDKFFAGQPDDAKFRPSIEAAYLLKRARFFVNWAKYSGRQETYGNVPRVKSAAYLFNSHLMPVYKLVILMQRLHLERPFARIVQRKMRQLTTNN